MYLSGTGRLFTVNHGAENLPPPLTLLERSELLDKILGGDLESRQSLICSYMRMALAISKRYDEACEHITNSDDLVSAAYMGVVLGVSDLEGGDHIRSNIDSYIAYKIHRAISTEIEHNTHVVRVPSSTVKNRKNTKLPDLKITGYTLSERENSSGVVFGSVEDVIPLKGDNGSVSYLAVPPAIPHFELEDLCNNLCHTDFDYQVLSLRLDNPKMPYSDMADELQVSVRAVFTTMLKLKERAKKVFKNVK